MPDHDPLASLEAAIGRQEPIIRQIDVMRAIHALLDSDLDAANAIEPRLVAAGYCETIRGDWFLERVLN